jgi:membrane protease YdiL (CAAX protease family)
VGYNHELEEAAPGARLERAAAQAVAESFLRDTLHEDLSLYDFREQEANLTERPARRDWSFSWERRGFRAKDAPYRLDVALAGDRVSGYSEFLKIPEAWTRDYDHLRSSNNTLEFIALIPYGFLIGGCLYVIISLGRRDLLDWRIGLALGAFLTILFFIMTMNQWPLDRASYDTNTPYSSFFLSQAGVAALTAIGSALLVVLAIVPGEPLYRILRPDKIRLNVGFSLPGIRTKEFFKANVIGICLAGAHIGYITIFYIISRKLGAWAPQDIKYENMVSTYVPWVYPLTIGIYAATSEEFLFRLFAIPFLLRTTKSRFLAVVLPAFFWGFLHSNYPQEPSYIRGLEVGLIGIVAGLVMLRWGIWATLIWHYTVDAFLISTSLMRTQGTYLRLSGAIVGGAALIPLAVAAILYVTHGGFVTDPTLLNSAQLLGGPAVEVPHTPAIEEAPTETVAPVATPAISPTYAGMSSRNLAVLIVGGLLGIALLAGIKREAIGDFVRFQIDSREATARGDEVLRGLRVDPNAFHRATTVAYTFDDYTNEYLRRAIGLAATNRIYREQVPSAFWTVRYFRDSQKEEYFVVMKPDGSLHSMHHTLDEKAAGANLTKEDAQARAEAFLRGEKHLNLADWNLVESHTDKKIARTDHTFEWEQKFALDSAADGQGAHVRITLAVQGDEVSGYRIFIKIPETWRDTESRSTPAQLAQSFAIAAALGLAFIVVVVVFLRNLKSPAVARVPWRPIGRLSIVMLLAGIVIYFNRAPQLLLNYSTSMPLIAYYVTLTISLVFATAIYMAGAVLLLGLSWFFLERNFGEDFTPGWTKWNAAYFRDAFCIAAFGSVAVIGLNRLPLLLLGRWPILHHSLGPSVPDNLDQLSPALGGFASGIAAAFVTAGFIGLATGLIAAYVRPAWMRAALLALVAVLMTSNVTTFASFLREAAVHLVVIFILWYGVTRIVRFNVLGYFLLAAMLALIPSALGLLQQPNPYFHANAYAVMAFAIGILAWPFVRWQRGAALE